MGCQLCWLKCCFTHSITTEVYLLCKITRLICCLSENLHTARPGHRYLVPDNSKSSLESQSPPSTPNGSEFLLPIHGPVDFEHKAEGFGVPRRTLLVDLLQVFLPWTLITICTMNVQLWVPRRVAGAHPPSITP